MNEQDIKGYASFYTYVILDNVCRAISMMTKQTFCHNLSKEDWYTIMEEFLFYNIVVCERLTYSWFGAEHTERIFEEIFEEIGSTIDENKEKILGDKLNLLNMQNFSDYLTSISSPNSGDLRKAYNQRAAEYAEYDLIRKDGNKSKAGMLDWEFTEKLANLLNFKDNATFSVCIDMIAVNHIGWLSSAKEVWDKLQGQRLEEREQQERNKMRKCPRCGMPNVETAFRCKNKDCLDILPTITQKESPALSKNENESWEEILKDVNFEKAKNEIAYMFKIAKEDAKMKGGDYYIKNELNDALIPFMSDPCLNNAIKLLEIAPFLSVYFEQSK